MRKIIIEQGNEFKIIVRELSEDDIFINEYNRAAIIVEEIVNATEQFDYFSNMETGFNFHEINNNIIAFCGERGQGKSSAMYAFSKYLKDAQKSSKIINFQENTRKSGFMELEPIDPSTFEDMHNIVEVVIARMFNKFSVEYLKDNTITTKEQKNTLMGLFQKVYESLCVIKNPKKLQEIESDYESSIQKIARIGDSTSLQKDIIKLVKKYLEIFVKEGKNKFLIVSIDDLDINVKDAYKISQQIRKYLIIPNVIIIMAIKIEQLNRAVEKECRDQLKNLLDSKHLNHQKEPIEMAEKYVEKLIPGGRRIYLPQVRAISKSGTDEVKIVFNKCESGKDINILEKYNDKGIEGLVLHYIYRKTKLVFVKPENGVHFIIPNTLRELVNLLSILGKMDDVDDKTIEIDHVEKNNKTTRLVNLKLFEDYFLNTWVPNNLDNENYSIVKELFEENDFKKHRLICMRLMEILDKSELYSLKNETRNDTNDRNINARKNSQKYIREIENKKRVLITQNEDYKSYSFGDVVDLIDNISSTFINTQVEKFVFAIKTVYSIVMNKILLNQSMSTLNNEANDIVRFIGGSIWGNKNAGLIRGGRVDFVYSTHKVMSVSIMNGKDYFRNVKLESKEIKDIINMTFCSNFIKRTIYLILSLIMNFIQRVLFQKATNRWKLLFLIFLPFLFLLWT